MEDGKKTKWSKPLEFRTLEQFVFISKMIKSNNSVLDYNAKMRRMI